MILPLLLTFTMTWWNEKFDRLLISKVSSDLTIARQYLGRILEHSGEKVRSLGASEAFGHEKNLEKACTFSDYT